MFPVAIWYQSSTFNFDIFCWRIVNFLVVVALIDVANGAPPRHQKSGRRAKIGKGKKGERKERRGKGRQEKREGRRERKRKGKGKGKGEEKEKKLPPTFTETLRPRPKLKKHC